MPAFYKTIPLLILLSAWSNSARLSAAEPPLVPASFSEDTTTIFPNPERGIYRWREHNGLTGLATMRSRGETLVFVRILADNFINQPFSAAFLNEIQSAFNTIRSQGLKAIPRISYNDGFDASPSTGYDSNKTWVLYHITQLQPLWLANKDVISHVDPGFIGAWGEWHGSASGLDNATDRQDIMNGLLAAVPLDRMVVIRYPKKKRDIFGNPPLAPGSAFNQSNAARVGHVNDCLMSSADDVGTYQFSYTRAQELTYLEAEGPSLPWGGESCALYTALQNCTNAQTELGRLHADYMNQDYEPNVISYWQTNGCFDNIRRRLGYRLVFNSGSFPTSVKPGGILNIQLAIRNAGWGELFNPRDVELVLRNNSTMTVYKALIAVDPRFWSGGTTANLDRLFRLPASLPTGTYSLLLNMGDKASNLYSDVRYSIRFANNGTWEASTGYNLLINNLSIDNAAPGSVDPAATVFQEISAIPTATPTFTATRTRTPTPTYTRTHTLTSSPTPSHTRTATPSFSSSPSITPTVTLTRTPTPSFTRTITLTNSPTPTATPTRTGSPTQTLSFTPPPVSSSPTWTPTVSETLTATPTQTLSNTPTFSATLTTSPTPSSSTTPSPTLSSSPSPTHTSTLSSTPSPSRTVTPTPSITPSVTASITATLSATLTITATESPVLSATPSETPAPSETATPTAVPATPETSGENAIEHSVPMPNPNPSHLMLKFKGPADKVLLRIYSSAHTCLHKSEVPGPASASWHTAPLPSEWLASTGNGTFYVVAMGIKDGTKGKAAKITKIQILK